jgi:hypothetical protein
MGSRPEKFREFRCCCVCLNPAASRRLEDIGAAFVVRDSNGQQLAYVYFEDEPGRRSAAKRDKMANSRTLISQFLR